MSEAERPGVVGFAVWAVLALAFVFLSLTAVQQKSPTVDEPVHLLSGYAMLKWGDYRVNPEHPPLAKWLAALPLLSRQVVDPRPSSPEWGQLPNVKPGIPTEVMARRMFFADNDADSLFFYGRVPFIAVGVVLGLLVFIWTNRWFGLVGGIAAAFFYFSDPNVLAHTPMIHTDVTFSLLFFASCYFFWRAWQDLTWLHVGSTALCFSLAAITKYSFWIIVPAWSGLAVVASCLSQEQHWSLGQTRRLGETRQRVAAFTVVLGCALVVAYVAIWAAYGFRFHAIPSQEQVLALGPVQPPPSLLTSLYLSAYDWKLFPEAWIYGQLYLLRFLERQAYLLGAVSADGFWLYFPVALPVKTPMPVLMLVGGALVAVFAVRRLRFALLIAAIPALVYFAFAVGSRMNIGVRHILPTYPFLFVLAGATVAWLWSSRANLKQGMVAVLVLWQVWQCTSAFPHYLAYFNELAGGSANGHKILIDSNLDWGQDLKGLKHWMQQKQQASIQLLYFGLADPAYYKINALYLPGSFVSHRFPGQEPFVMPEYLAASANLVFGRELFLNRQQQAFLREFQLSEPVDAIGHSILIYRLDLSQARLHHAVGHLLAGQGDLHRAAQSFRRAIELQPRFAEAHGSLAQVLSLQGQNAEAEKHQNAALELRGRPGAAMPRP